jgi:hypothetical protein
MLDDIIVLRLASHQGLDGFIPRIRVAGVQKKREGQGGEGGAGVLAEETQRRSHALWGG